MSFLYIGFIFANLGLSWLIYSIYSRNCRSTSTRPMDHGALEFNATFFGLQFLLLGFIARNKKGSWIIGAIGASLVLYVARRFWLHWERSDDRE